MPQTDERGVKEGWRHVVHELIFEADTPAGKAFDIALIFAILISVIAVVLESVSSIEARFGLQLQAIEWFFTILFTIEYVLRLVSVRRPGHYARSFFGIVDFLSIIPTYLALVIPGGQTLLTIRALRLLRIFRVFKLTSYVGEARGLVQAMKASMRKISVFLLAVLMIVVIVGSLMYVIEGSDGGFSDIPSSVYWAIVTLTTVGYGDIAPQTILGKAFASLVMIMGYGIIAVPTGIVTVELSRGRTYHNTQSCQNCALGDHADDALYCRRCGADL